MDKNKQLYFVALVPSVPVLEEVVQFKEEVFDRYSSKAALRSPPHITLHMPFQYREDREETLFATLEDQIKGHKSFGVEHDGFGCFEPRVIFINTTKTEALQSLRSDIVIGLRKELNILNAEYKNRGFHPHMTIAFRDLKKALFSEAWDYYRNQEFNRSWVCESVCLLKHTGKEWLIHREFKLHL